MISCIVAKGKNTRFFSGCTFSSTLFYQLRQGLFTLYKPALVKLVTQLDDIVDRISVF